VFGTLKGRIRELLTPRIMPAARYQRQEGPLDDCHNEWSLVVETGGAGQASSPELTALAHQAIARASTMAPRFLADRTTTTMEIWPGEHYRLLPALCEVADARRVVEIGTWRGESALALLASPVVEHVDTFDVISWEHVDEALLTAADFGPRLAQHVADLGQWPTFQAYAETLQSADLVFVDGPKDGVFEPTFVPWLLALPRNRRLLVVLDDIRLMTMIRLWRSLPAPKLDVTSFGHWAGTGLLLA
jgi:predicted O-methyltransferase YrrM